MLWLNRAPTRLAKRGTAKVVAYVGRQPFTTENGNASAESSYRGRRPRPGPSRPQRWSRTHLPWMMVAVVLLFGSTSAWSDEKIGGAEIIIDGVQGDLASGSTVPVVQGDAVYRDEGVQTHVDSKARLLLEDKTNVTIGPSSTVKLDRFVRAGTKQPGTIVLNLANGTCRLVVGGANKRAYTIVTPTAVIGIRN